MGYSNGKVILQTLQASDSQKTYSDKANYNFHLLADYINGVKTIKGDKGNVGMPGATGRQGIQGERGNSLFVYESEFPSPNEKTYEDLKKKYVSWCEENGITDGDLVLFMDKEAIYKSGVNNDDKVPHEGKIEEGGDLVIDLSKIISDFVDEKTKTSEFWDRIDQDRDIITLKQYLDIDSKKNNESAKIVLAPDMINNDDVRGYVANKLAEAPLNIYSHIGGNNVNDIYSYQSGISLNSIYVLNGNYSVEDSDREFRITQRSIRKDKNNTDEIDYVEGLFVVAPQTSSSNRDGMTSGFRFISKAVKDSDSNSNTKKNNIVTIGDGKFTNGMLMNGYGGENVENAITFARGNAEPVTDSQFGGFFSIGTEYDKDINGNYKIKGFIRTESRVGAKTGDLVVGGYDTFLTFSYDSSSNKIFSDSILNITSNNALNIYSDTLNVVSDKNIDINSNSGDINIKTNKVELFLQKDNKIYLRYGDNNYVYIDDKRIQYKVINSSITLGIGNLDCYITDEKETNRSFRIINNLVSYIKDNSDFSFSYVFGSSITTTNRKGRLLIQPNKEKNQLTSRLEIVTCNKSLELYNVLGKDNLSLMFPHFEITNASELVNNDTVGKEQEAGGSLQFKVPIPIEDDNFFKYNNWSEDEKWKDGYLGYIGAYTIKGKKFKSVTVVNSSSERNDRKILPIGSYGIGINSKTDLKLNAQGKISTNADSIDFTAKTINIGDANSTVNIAGNTGRPYLIKHNGDREVFNWYCLDVVNENTYITSSILSDVETYNYFIKPPIVNFTKDGVFYIGIDKDFFSFTAHSIGIAGPIISCDFCFIYKIGNLNITQKTTNFDIHYDFTAMTQSRNMSMGCFYNNTGISLPYFIGLKKIDVYTGELLIKIHIGFSSPSLGKIWNDMCQSFVF